MTETSSSPVLAYQNFSSGAESFMKWMPGNTCLRPSSLKELVRRCPRNYGEGRKHRVTGKFYIENGSNFDGRFSNILKPGPRGLKKEKIVYKV